jgi:hypothetical protein
MHTIHDDIRDVGLVDGCPRCEEHAEHPIRDLDLANLRRLIELACDRSIRPRSQAEGVAAANVLTAMERFGKIAEADPAMAVDYLKRWGIEVVAFDVSQ